MNRNTRMIIAALLTIAVGVGIAVVAYNAGLSHAAAGGGRAWAPPPGAQVVYVRPWGFGFGFFPIFFLIFLFFIFSRALFWGGRRWHGHYRCVREAQEPPVEQKL